ncbi:hypothetical protein GCM10023147_45030 [Tsukamurella soli]|uniref:Uncharacterized protein n=2 Tax=Tsukamurella soli TaxID=644556 RepID=A0ABP8KBM0_9ACTN
MAITVSLWSTERAALVNWPHRRAPSRPMNHSEPAAWTAGRDAARTLRRELPNLTATDAGTYLPAALHPDDADAWLRGFRSAL